MASEEQNVPCTIRGVIVWPLGSLGHHSALGAPRTVPPHFMSPSHYFASHVHILPTVPRRKVSPGTCVHVAAGTKHRIQNTGDEDLVLLYFGIATEPVVEEAMEHSQGASGA